tara:strand:- start:131 stop:361 length:231 start_codon:yes stop_codon:yes gene_type:complete
MTFGIDDWVLYRPFPDNPDSMLYEFAEKAVVLDVLSSDLYYDYKIYIDDGTGKIKKVRKKHLEPLPQKSGGQCGKG